MREEENSSAYPYTLVDMFLNSTQLDYCSGMMIDPTSREIIKKGRLPFLNTDKFYSTVQSTTLSSATTVGATTLTVASTSGYTTTVGEMKLWINGNIITYTGVTSTSFTGVTGVLFPFEAGTQVSQVFVLPSDYMSPLQVVYNNIYKLPAKEYDQVYNDLKDIKGGWNDYNNRGTYMYGPTAGPFYTIKDNAYLILWNINVTGNSLLFRYQKKPTTLSATSDTATIDNDTYAKIILSSFAAAEVLSFRGEELRAKQIMNEGVIRRARTSYDYYNNSMFEDINGMRVQSGHSGRGYNI